MQNEALKDTRLQIGKKISLIEKTILEKLDSNNGGNDMGQFLKSFDDTISKLEYDVDVLSKDFIQLKNTMTQDL